MHKIDIEKLTQQISKADFEAYLKDHTRDELMVHFGISRSAYTKLKEYYNIQKSTDDIIKCRKQTCMTRYGVEAPSQNKEIAQKGADKHDYESIIQKSKQTCLKKYGVESFSQTNEFKNQMREKMSDPDKILQSKEKRKRTNLDKYGVENTFESTEVQNQIKSTNLEKYGSEFYIQSEDFKNKTKKTLLDKYGVDHYSKVDGFKEKLQETSRDKYNVDFPQQLDQVKEKTKQTNLLKYGVEYYIQTEEGKQKFKTTCQDRYGGTYVSTPEFLDKFKNSCQEHLGVDFPAQSRHVQQLAAKTRQRTAVAEDGTLLDSNWECLVYNYCIRNNLSIERNIPIKFEYNDTIHTTFIDFKIDGILCEVKATHLLKGCFDHKAVIPIDKKLEIYEKNQVVIITDYKDLFNHYPKLHGIDINLFNNPEFPYRADRPKCFYTVRVNNQKSSLEAFEDEKIRWKMIKNRLQYGKPFIDANQILTALNVTKTAKQPSWFKQKFAETLINKYCTENTIVDLFAGWGTRHDACVNLNRNYIGIDKNVELVQWHQQQQRNIILGDAETFTYNEKCSVFICPPYQDIEVYFENQNIKYTQCDWLKICMQNVPNATEYVMVCKNVDKGWEKYIVEQKENNSLFNSSVEYVLKISNEESKKLVQH